MGTKEVVPNEKAQSRMRSVKPQEFLKAFGRLGFEPVCKRTSHIKLRHSDGRKVTLSVHSNKREIGGYLLRGLLKKAGVNQNEFETSV